MLMARRINLEAETRKIDVDQNLPLKYYFRTAKNLIEQADFYRREGNKVQLYVLLMRYASLVVSTIPQHKDYSSSVFTQQKETHRTLVRLAVSELETLRPEVQRIVSSVSPGFSLWDAEDDEWGQQDGAAPVYLPDEDVPQLLRNTNEYSFGTVQQGPGANQWGSRDGFLHSRPGSAAMAPPSSSSFDLLTGAAHPSFLLTPASVAHTLSNLQITGAPAPRQETFSRHSFFSQYAPSTAASNNGSQRQEQLQVTYPKFDMSPVDLPDLLSDWPPTSSTPSSTAPASSSASSSDMSQAAPSPSPPPPPPAAAPQEPPGAATTNLIRQPAPPPVLAEVHTVQAPHSDTVAIQHKQAPPGGVKQPRPLDVADPRPGKAPRKKGSGLKSVHISLQLMEEFMRIVHHNTSKNLETCAILAGKLKGGKFYISTLVLPKQTATSDSCSTLNEEEVFEAQDKRGLFQLGWIHTHPSQACFMSSVDLHTHYSYQVMLPEAIAVVMAPTDSVRKYGIFRLADPGGMKVLQNCQERGFHPHSSPPGGGPIYEHSSHVYFNPKLKFDVIDLRSIPVQP